MANSVSLIRATKTTTSTLFSKLLRSTHSRSLKTMVPLPLHYPNKENSTDSTQDHLETGPNIHSFIERGRAQIADLKETAKEDSIFSDTAKELMGTFYIHPFQKEGPERPFEIKEDKDNLYARIDMPGVGKEGVKVWMEKDELFFKGEVVEKNPEYGDLEFVRTFQSSFYIPPCTCETDKVKFVVNNGVVWIVVPKFLKISNMVNFSQVKVEY